MLTAFWQGDPSNQTRDVNMMSYIKELAARITQLRGEHHTLKDIGIALKNEGLHIQNVQAAFQEAGFKAEVTTRTILGITQNTLTVRDNSQVVNVRDLAFAAIAAIRTGNNDEEMKKMRQTADQKTDSIAIITW